MTTDALVLQDVFGNFQREPADTAASIGAQNHKGDAARSKKNILQWMTYLPTDCVNTMTRMGWDIST